jgi:hypothetical protein
MKTTQKQNLIAVVVTTITVLGIALTMAGTTVSAQE